MRLDSIFKALGVETMEDIERLTSYFMISKSKVGEEVKIGEHEHPDEEDTKFESRLIHPNDVVRAIRSFVEESRYNVNGIRRQRGKPSTAATQKSVDFIDEDEGKESKFVIYHF